MQEMEGLLPVQVRCGRERQVGGAVALLSRGGVEERGKEEGAQKS